MQAVLVLVGLQPDVVPEPLGLLVRVGVAADVGQQRRVVDRDPRLLLDADVLREAQCDQALAEYVLHRLVEPEVDAQREGGHDLRQTDLPETFVASHASSVRAVITR